MNAVLPDPYAVTTHEALAALYDPPKEMVLRKISPVVDGTAAAFIARSPFLVLGTGGHRGLHCTPRGDAPGFVAVLDERTLAMPDRRGNNRIDALRDVLDDPRAHMLFLVPGAGECLRVSGTVRLTTDPVLRTRFAVRGSEPAVVLVLRVTDVFVQCPRAVIRAGLWNGRDRPEGLPTAGQMLAAHTGGLVDAATYDTERAPIVSATLY